jgi:hypothetical protein
MSFFTKVGANLRDRKRTVAAVLAFATIAVASFFAGTWTSSSGAFTLGPAKASQQQAPDAPKHPDAPKPEGMCCGMPMPMPMDKMDTPKDKLAPHMQMPMPGETPTRSNTPMPSNMPMPSGMPMPSRTP